MCLNKNRPKNKIIKILLVSPGITFFSPFQGDGITFFSPFPGDGYHEFSVYLVIFQIIIIKNLLLYIFIYLNIFDVLTYNFKT